MRSCCARKSRCSISGTRRAFATGHPLFAANMAADRIAIEAELRLPRKDVPIVLYDDGEGLVAQAARTPRRHSATPMSARSPAGSRPGARPATKSSRTSIPTPRRSANWSRRAAIRRRCGADEVASLIADKANIAILDVRRFDEYTTMNIPGSVSVPGAGAGAARRPTRRPIPTPPSSSTAPAAPARSSARSR